MIRKSDLQKDINTINAEYEWQRLSLKHHGGNKFIVVDRHFSLTPPLTIKNIDMFLSGYERACRIISEKVQALVEFQEEIKNLTEKLAEIRRR